MEPENNRLGPTHWSEIEAKMVWPWLFDFVQDASDRYAPSSIIEAGLLKERCLRMGEP